MRRHRGEGDGQTNDREVGVWDQAMMARHPLLAGVSKAHTLIIRVWPLRE